MTIPKLIAFYFPQFHAIPENDVWWGAGFHDWQLVQNAKPLFNGHYQPRIPIDGNYYNPCDKETLAKQARLASEYGVGGFSFYHYWFDGKLMLEKPLETFLEHKQIDIPSCLTWANETWTRAWIGHPEAVLIQQNHTDNVDLWRRHFDYLLPFFKDERAIRIDNKPLLLIYQPFIIANTQEMFGYWRKWAEESGLPGLYLMAVKGHQYPSCDFLKSYDGLLKTQPREAFGSKHFKHQNLTDRFYWLRKLPESIQNYLRKINQSIRSYQIIDANELWEVILKNAYCPEFKESVDIYETAFFDWDNTARYKNKAKIYRGLSFDSMENNLTELMKKAREHDSPYVFFNAWNEWSEGAYLEPDLKNGYRYLEIVKRVNQNLSAL